MNELIRAVMRLKAPVRVLASLILLANSLNSPAQEAATPEATVRGFYGWYLHSLNQSQDPLKKPQAELSKFVTQRLIRSLNRALKRPDGIDADYFIDAQDWDEAWERNITTSKATLQGERAIVNVTLKGGEAFGNKTLKAGLRKEAGAWKIESINARLNP